MVHTRMNCGVGKRSIPSVSYAEDHEFKSRLRYQNAVAYAMRACRVTVGRLKRVVEKGKLYYTCEIGKDSILRMSDLIMRYGF